MAIDFKSPATSSVLTADGVVGTSGADTLLWGIAVTGGAAATTLADVTAGTDGTGAVHLNILTLAATTDTMSFPTGIFIPGGIHLDITTTGGSVTFVFNQ